jgi:hypothetical protein
MTDSKQIGWIDEILQFWFEQLTPADWFAGKPELYGLPL